MNDAEPILSIAPDPGDAPLADLLPDHGSGVLVPAAHISEEEDFLRFFGLNEMPFPDAVNPKFFYKTDGHDEALIRLTLALRHDMALGLVTGPSGSGKTLLSQLLLQQLDPARFEAALILASPGLSKTALLKAVMRELGLPVPEGPFVSAQELLARIQDRVIELHQQGRKLALVVDECHFLAPDSLHMIRTLTNLETPDRKLVTILLFGEDRFLKRLQHPSYESIRNRLYLRSELKPLTAADTEQFIKFRLMVAGRLEDLFDADAFAGIHEWSGGICRRINKLATLSLIEGFAKHSARISGALVRAAAERS